MFFKPMCGTTNHKFIKILYKNKFKFIYYINFMKNILKA
jgi:hypothetical protein